MNFLKLLGKKGQESKDEELDLPPLPPQIKGDKGLGWNSNDEEQNFSESEELPGLDDLETIPEKGLPEMPPPIEPLDNNADIPKHEFPDIDEEMDEDELFPDKGKAGEPFKLPTKSYGPDMGYPPEGPNDIEDNTPLFIKMNKYKSVIKNINSIKKDFQTSKNALLKLEEIKGGEDKEFESWKHGLEDIRKKLSFIDKNLHKGNI